MLEFGKVHLGDCIDLMGEFPPGYFDSVCTDPPWPGCKVDTGWNGEDWWKEVVQGMERVLAPAGKIIIHLNCETNPAPFLSPFRIPFVHVCWLRYVPPRYRGTILNEADLAYVLGDYHAPEGKTVLSASCVSPSRRDQALARPQHPCPRGIDHVEWLIRTQIGTRKRVLDPFCGSGTTAIAAAMNKCEFVGFEKNMEYCDEANERISLYINGLNFADKRAGQGSLLEGNAKCANGDQPPG